MFYLFNLYGKVKLDNKADCLLFKHNSQLSKRNNHIDIDT